MKIRIDLDETVKEDEVIIRCPKLLQIKYKGLNV